MKNILVTIALLSIINVNAQTDSIQFKKYQLNTGLTISPQMLFIGALDIGLYANVESHPFNNPIAVLAGLDIRNKFVQLDIDGLYTKNLKTHYSANFIGSFGLGYSFISKKRRRNSFYITGTPYYFTFKESVKTNFIDRTSSSNSFNFNLGITWTNTKKTKRGKEIQTQFYFPFYGSHFLDEIRIMNFKIGITI